MTGPSLNRGQPSPRSLRLPAEFGLEPWSHASPTETPLCWLRLSATFDVLSNGRLEFGIGAGTQKAEHLAYGFDFPNLASRIERLAESLEVIKRLWTQERANFRGKHYSLKNAVCEPKPLQKPHPTITVGGCSDLLLQKATAPIR